MTIALRKPSNLTLLLLFFLQHTISPHSNTEIAHNFASFLNFLFSTKQQQHGTRTCNKDGKTENTHIQKYVPVHTRMQNYTLSQTYTNSHPYMRNRNEMNVWIQISCV